MASRDSFLKRAFVSLKSALTHPVGGKVKELKEPSPRPLAEPEQAEPVVVPDLSVVPPMQIPLKRTVWGREFDTSEEGLSEDQVNEIVSNLTAKCRALEQQQKHFLTLGSLSERAAIEADKAAAVIKARAKSEAEAESARIMADANQKIQEMMIEAKKMAHQATAQEVQGILQAAIKRAAIIEVQAKQQAQMFLIRSREAIEGDLREEVKEAYYRLLSGAHNVLGEGNKLEISWRDRTLELRKRDTFELEAPEAGSSALGSEISKTPPLALGESMAGLASEPDWRNL